MNKSVFCLYVFTIASELTALTTKTPFAFSTDQPGGKLARHRNNATTEKLDNVWNDSLTSTYVSENDDTTIKFSIGTAHRVNISALENVTVRRYFNSGSTISLDDVNVSSTTRPEEYPPMVAHCQLHPIDPRIHYKVNELLEEQVKLIDMHLTVTGYQMNPLDVSTWPKTTSWNVVDSNQSTSRPYKADSWSRVSDGHGQTLLKLAFNYGVLSLMTLSYGVEPLEVELRDVPAGCLGNLTDDKERLEVVLDIILRDMLPAGIPRIIQGESNVCYKVVEPINSMLRFTNRCCHYRLRDPQVLTDADGISGQAAGQPGDLFCFIDAPNKWLHTLDVLLATLYLTIFVFGPLFLPNWLYTSSIDTYKYVVKLKKPIHKTMCVSRTSTLKDIKVRHRLDLRYVDRDDFARCLKIIRHLPSDVIIPITIPQLDIKVNYNRLLEESRVPVSLVECLSTALFLCKLRELDAFRDCCEASYVNDWYSNPFSTGRPRPWFDLCEALGRILLVLILPFPFYIRLLLYYHFEHSEVMDRTRMASEYGHLPIYYSYHIIQYLTPGHPVFIASYVIYFTVGIYLACFSHLARIKSRFQQALTDSFADLKRMSWLNAMSMLVRNLLYPFRRFGFLGCLVTVLVYPVLIPMSLAFCFIYSLPLVYVSSRVVRHIFTDARHLPGHRQPRSAFNEMVHAFEADSVIKSLKNNKKWSKKCACYFPGWRPLVHHSCNVLMTILALLSILSVLLMMAEVAGYVAEIGCFTMMGLIVNATKVLKYGSLIFLVLIYSHDSYSNVTKKYQKLNKALFSEIKSRISGLAEYTSLPSYLQENMGFKACDSKSDNKEEGTAADDFAVSPPGHWNISDLILFVDSEDTPRIPKRIFDDACQIKVAGTPGPVYLSLLNASKRFIVIIFFLVFVFIVVMSFGDTYKISSTNQMLATIAGGFIPFIFNGLLKPVSADIETNLVGFKSKLEEIIKNFRHAWPMSDLVFNVDIATNTGADNNGMMQQTSGYCPDLTNPLIEADDIKTLMEHTTFSPAAGKTVDFVVLIDDDISEWDFELSPVGSEQSLNDTKIRVDIV